MNDKKVAFIICSNDQQYLDECTVYIRSLIVPPGITIEIIPIIGAKSMCAGYNTGMRSTDAKYKVYLHQDVFIINRNFITDIIKIFCEDENIGMLGVAGSTDLPADAKCHFCWDRGVVYECYGYVVRLADSGFNKLSYVWAVDGLLIATSKDLTWREDRFDGWDFYDISQAMEFMEAGYKIAVPYQEHSWTFHDNGILNYENYDKYRKIFCETYSRYFEYSESEDHREKNDEYKKDLISIRNIMPEMRRLFDTGRYMEAVGFVSEWHAYKNKDNDLFSLYVIAAIISEELKAGKKCLGKEGRDADALIYEYQKLRFMLIRLAFDIEPEIAPKILIERGDISEEAINILMDIVIYDDYRTKVKEKIKNLR